MTELWEANTPDYEIATITKKAVERKKGAGNITGRTVIMSRAANARFYLHPKADVNDRLEYYKNLYPDAEIAK